MVITQTHLAKHLGISQRSVSVAFGGAGRISDETRISVLEAAEKLGYRHNRLASSLRKGESGSIGVIWAFVNPWTGDSQIGMTLLQRLQERGLTTYQAHHGNNLETDLLCRHLEDLRGRRVDAIVMEGIPHELMSPKVLGLIQDIPVVAVCREDLPDFPGDLVIHDRYEAIHQVVDHFIASGRKRIGIALAMDEESNPPKFDIFRRRCRHHGLPEHRYELLPLPYPERPSTEGERHATMMRQCFPKAVDLDAIFCFNDVGAMYVIKDLLSRGLRVPEDVAVAGFNNIEPASAWEPPLASGDRCFDQVTDAVDRLLAERMADSNRDFQRETVHMRFVHRRSAG